LLKNLNKFNYSESFLKNNLFIIKFDKNSYEIK